MARIRDHNAAHTYGVLSPLMVERRDTKFVKSSLADAANVIMLPQGGYRDAGGTRRHGAIRRALQAVTIEPGMVTAPNGGEVGNLISGDGSFLTDAVDADPFVLFEIDFGGNRSIDHFDLNEYRATGGERQACVKLQYHAPGGFTDFPGAAQDISGRARSRRFALAPAQAGTILTHRIRVIVTGGPSIGQIAVRAGIAAAYETGSTSPAFVRRYNRDTDQYYQLVLTAGTIDIYKNGTWLAAGRFPATGPMLKSVKHEPGYDTVLFFHQQLPPWRLQWQGSDSEWDSSPVPLENLPLVDYGGVYTNGVTEVQRIEFFDITTGDEAVIQLEGEETESFVVGDVNATVATNIKNALEALPNVGPGLTVTHIDDEEYEIAFTGVENANRDWLEMEARVTNNVASAVLTRTITDGKEAGEPIISAERGWPAVGKFAQQRLILAGFKPRPQGWLMSVTGDPYNFDTTRVGATAAQSYDLDDDDEATIRDIAVGRTIIFFTDTAPWHLDNPKLSAEEVPLARRTDGPGIDPAVRPISVDNAIYYVEKGGITLRQISYSAVEENYIADNASVLSSHLIKQPQDMALRRASHGVDSDLLIIVNGDGSITHITVMRTQDVSGFSPRLTAAGGFQSACVSGNQTTWYITNRSEYGVQRRVLEEALPQSWGGFDCQRQVNLDPPSTTVATGPFEGTTLDVMADGEYYRFPSCGAFVTLDRPAAVAVLGHWLAPFALDTPFFLEDETNQITARLKRCFAVVASVLDTTVLAIGANGEPPIEVPWFMLDQTPTDTTAGKNPRTKRIRTEGYPGWTEEGHSLVTQLHPGKLVVRSIAKELVA